MIRSFSRGVICSLWLPQSRVLACGNLECMPSSDDYGGGPVSQGKKKKITPGLLVATDCDKKSLWDWTVQISSGFWTIYWKFLLIMRVRGTKPQCKNAIWRWLLKCCSFESGVGLSEKGLFRGFLFTWKETVEQYRQIQFWFSLKKITCQKKG